MFEVRSLHLGAAMPTRREATIIIVALVLFLFYFNATAPTEQLTASKGSLQGLRDFVLGPSGPDYSREFGSEFAKSIQAALARWHAHETLQLRDEGSARKVHTNWQDAVPPTRVVTHVPGACALQTLLVAHHLQVGQFLTTLSSSRALSTSLRTTSHPFHRSKPSPTGGRSTLSIRQTPGKCLAPTQAQWTVYHGYALTTTKVCLRTLSNPSVAPFLLRPMH